MKEPSVFTSLTAVIEWLKGEYHSSNAGRDEDEEESATVVAAGQGLYPARTRTTSQYRGWPIGEGDSVTIVGSSTIIIFKHVVEIRILFFFLILSLCANREREQATLKLTVRVRITGVRN